MKEEADPMAVDLLAEQGKILGSVDIHFSHSMVETSETKAM